MDESPSTIDAILGLFLASPAQRATYFLQELTPKKAALAVGLVGVGVGYSIYTVAKQSIELGGVIHNALKK